jgi:hypothetical protein
VFVQINKQPAKGLDHARAIGRACVTKRWVENYENDGDGASAIGVAAPGDNLLDRCESVLAVNSYPADLFGVPCKLAQPGRIIMYILPLLPITASNRAEIMDMGEVPLVVKRGWPPVLIPKRADGLIVEWQKRYR